MWDFLDRECGDRIAVVDPIHPATDDESDQGKRARKGAEARLTYGEMRTSVDTVAGALMQLGVQREVCGDIVRANALFFLFIARYCYIYIYAITIYK